MLVLLIVGLAMGSFINALIWRLWRQEQKNSGSTKIKGKSVNLSIVHGRSVCIHCGHELQSIDLMPLFSWLSLRGKCRYCKKPIDDSPVIEVVAALLFAVSYLAWPSALGSTLSWLIFILWLAILVGLIALAAYDLKHMLLPNRIVFPLMGLAALQRLLVFINESTPPQEALVAVIGGILVGGGAFYLIYQVSRGSWIGGGDVKLGFLIGLYLGPQAALIALLVAFYSAAIIVLPLMLLKRVTRKSRIPFGPFLIGGFIVAVLYADVIRDFYLRLFGL